MRGRAGQWRVGRLSPLVGHLFLRRSAKCVNSPENRVFTLIYGLLAPLVFLANEKTSEKQVEQAGQACI
jgi:hypothetical protein